MKQQKSENLNRAEKFVKKAIEEVIRAGHSNINIINMRVHGTVETFLKLYQGVGMPYKKMPPEYERAITKFCPYDLGA